MCIWEGRPKNILLHANEPSHAINSEQEKNKKEKAQKEKDQSG